METLQILEKMKEIQKINDAVSLENSSTFNPFKDEESFPKDKISLHREKHLIYIFNPEQKQKRIRYNLRTKQLEFLNKSLCWQSTSQQYSFFRFKRIDDLFCKEEKFKVLLRKTSDLNPKCSSLSTFLSRMHEALIYENYGAQGILTECYVNYSGHKVILSKPVEFYSKPILAFFREYEIKISRSIESEFISDYKFWENFVIILHKLDFTREEKTSFFSSAINESYDLKSLVKTYNFDTEALIKYILGYLIPFENYRVYDAIRDLRDYYSMGIAIGRTIKKYPKYLKSMHDIMSSNFKAFKKEYQKECFKIRDRPELEYEEKDFCTIIPREPKDVVNEGACLNHCVGSYIDKIINGQTYIFFLRKTEDKENPLITLEIRNDTILQAKGSYNRPMNEEEAKFLEKYCKKFKFKLNL